MPASAAGPREIVITRRGIDYHAEIAGLGWEADRSMAGAVCEILRSHAPALGLRIRWPEER